MLPCRPAMSATTDNTPLYLIDASIYIFRAYFALPDSIRDAQGRPANAVYGFAGFIQQLLQRVRSPYIAFAFDESLTHSFRNRLYPAYKANRELPPAELAAQLRACQDLTTSMGLASFVSQEYEADDIIGTIARKMRPKGFRMVIVSSDKDLAQLIETNDRLWDFAREQTLVPRHIKQRYGVKPSQIVDLLALMGDSADNIPGVPGIGVKTAAELLQRHHSLDAIYNRLQDLHKSDLRGAQRLQKLLAQHRDQAYLSQQLATINDKMPLRCPVNHLRRKRVRRAALLALCQKLDFSRNTLERLLQA